MMAVRKDAMMVQALTIDPAVESALGRSPDDPVYGGLQKVRRARNMTPGQRRKAERDAVRCRAMFDLPEDLLAALDRLAERLGVPRSQAAAYLMLVGLGRLAAEGEEALAGLRRPSRSMRFEWQLDLPDLPDVFR